MSISWSRVIPNGTAPSTPKGWLFTINWWTNCWKPALPLMSRFPWDYPYELSCRGGWLNPDSSEWFADYTRVVVDKLSDRVTNWMTINEPQVFINHGHQQARMRRA